MVEYMGNPVDDKGLPICPACFKPIPLGQSAIRAEDELFVHLECLVMPWRPRPKCPICATPIRAGQPTTWLYGYALHDHCWQPAGAGDAPGVAPDAPGVA
jgi:hypothetical protein